MKTDLKNRWVSALRSGAYKQCRGHYHCEDKFCAIGVLKDVSGAIWKKNPRLGTAPQTYYTVGAQTNLGDYFVDIVALNDIKKKDFAEIANWVEQNVLVD